MFISKLLIDAKMPAVRHDLNSPDFFYNTVKAITGDEKPLYRIENIPLYKTEFIQPVVILSETKPDTAKSGKPCGYFTGIESMEYNVPVKNGRLYKFMLKANPTVKMFFKHFDVDTDEARLKWLESESISNGFEIIESRCTDDGYIVNNEKKSKVLSVIFEGSLKITDEKKFQKALFSGIGGGRSSGLGLLSVESFGCKNRNIAEEMKNSAGN